MVVGGAIPDFTGGATKSRRGCLTGPEIIAGKKDVGLNGVSGVASGNMGVVMTGFGSLGGMNSFRTSGRLG